MNYKNNIVPLYSTDYSVIQQFCEAMRSSGITPPENIQANGHLERFHIQGDKSNSLNGWYVLYADAISSGAFGSWKTGESYKWRSRSHKKMNRQKWIADHQKMQNAVHHQKMLKKQEQLKVAKKARERWQNYKPADLLHPYLINKQIAPYIARQSGNCLVLPITDYDGLLWSLQYIQPDGVKKLLTGGAKKNHFILIQGELNQTEHILICEGFATGATLAEAYPEACVIAAIDASNITSVAKTIRQYLPNTKITVCADDDRQTPNNPGMTKGQQAAIAANAFFISPKWPKDAPKSLTDFNDLSCWASKNMENN